MTARFEFRSLRVVTPGTPGGRATLLAGRHTFRCAIGSAGVRRDKHEGDGATPRGAFHLLAALYRADRMARPVTRLPLTAQRPDSGWCDDPGHPAYNRPVRLPFAGRHERLWRDDPVYDVIVILDYNLDPVRSGAGSAIFLHLARDDFAPTAGCVAISRAAMLRLLPRLAPTTVLEIP